MVDYLPVHHPIAEKQILKMPPSVALLTRQVAHYHHSRFSAAGQTLPRLDVLSVANEGEFAQVLAATPPENYLVHKVYQSLETYRSAAARGEVGRAISDNLDLIDPDVVAIGGWASPESYAGLTWARLNRRGVIVMSDSRAQDTSRNFLRDWIKSRIVQACDAGFAAGRIHQDYLVALGLSRDNIRLGYDTVDNAYFRMGAQRSRTDEKTLRAKLSLPDRYIFASARFIPKKNLATLIRAYGRACNDLNEPPTLLIAGDGENRAALEAASRELKIGQVRMPGFFSYEDLPALYGLAQGFIHIPRSEQWGLVVNEAAAAGLPIVASQECGAASELVQEGSNGWQVPADDLSAVSDALRQMMELTPDAQTKMGGSSQEIVSAWGPERFASALAEAASLAQRSQKRLTFLDRAIIRAMSRRIIETVA